MKKKEIIIICTLLTLLIAMWGLAVIKNHNKNDNEATSEKITESQNEKLSEEIIEEEPVTPEEPEEPEEEVTVEPQQPIEQPKKEEPKKEQTKKEEKPSSNTNNNNNNTGNNTNPPTPEEPVVEEPSGPTYSCPSGYTLNGSKCTTSIAATPTCPTNAHPYNNNRNCIDFNDGYEISEGETCPSGYGYIAEHHLDGTDSVYKCLRLTDISFTCDDDYQLEGNQCVKTIDATEN